MRTRKLPYRKLVVAFLVIFSLTGSLAGPTTAESQKTTLTIAFDGDLTSLNTFYWRIVADLDTLRLIYEPMFRISTEGLAVPNIVKDWSVSSDGLTWTFQITNNITWHDGIPLTAEDVKFSLEFIRDHALPYLGTIGELTETVEITGEWEVKMTLKSAFAPLAIVMGEFGFVVPKHIWEPLEDPATFTNEEAIGNGPFKFVEREPGAYVRLEANDNYFRGRPYVDEVIIKIIPSLDAQTLAIRKGEIDMMHNVPVGPHIRVLMGAENVKVVAAPSTNIQYLSINCRPERAPLHIKELRQAMAYAMDRETFVSVIADGFGDPADSFITPSLSFWYNPDVPKYAFNLTRAYELLDSINFKDRNGDGVRETPAGKPLEFELLTGNWGNGPRIAKMLKSMLAEIGVDVKIKLADSASYWDLLLTRRDFDMSQAGWRLYFDPDPYIYESFHTSRDIPGGLNWVGYNSTYDHIPDTFDKLAEAQRTAVDINERQELLFKMQDALTEYLPWIPLIYPDLLYVVRTDTFEGWVPMTRYGLMNLWTFLNVRPPGAVTQTVTTKETVTVVSEVPVWAATIVTAIVVFGLIIPHTLRRIKKLR
ncbi:MAG: ABC transporter substrate-binding protein [Candidatus Hodarchaeota archaeon]